mmetsp:Transcript_11814/g.31965  ORF Transcript_11814/g.31965 Transcript_11814/m.31965 type:complete len:346 (-) Transcript_11814:357-1394(-)
MASQSRLKVASGEYYSEYYGHRVADLTKVLEGLRSERPEASTIWLAGDSSLDNKHWLFPDTMHSQAASRPRVMMDTTATAAACNGYGHVLTPPRMVKDVNYFVNWELERQGVDAYSLNCAREESTIQDREGERGLMPQDLFIKDNIRPGDTLVVSVGGNDIALRPTPATIVSMAMLLYLSTHTMIEYGVAPGLWYFQNMYRNRVQAYVEKLVSKTKPKRVIINMLYFLDETPGGSWADPTLARLGYDNDPTKLQTLIRTIYATATKRIRIAGTEVIALPLFEIMDGKDSLDYDQRVEPSVQGGSKMGKFFVGTIVARDAAIANGRGAEEPASNSPAPPARAARGT